MLLALLAGVSLLSLVPIALIAALGAIMAQEYSSIASTVQPADALLQDLPRGGARVYDRHGVLLYEFVDEYSGLRRPVRLSEISEWAQIATIATEDADFYENNGVNVRGLTRAALENFAPFLLGDEAYLQGSGGSSITQQLAKNIYIPREQRTERSMDRKIRETVIALELTKRHSKEQILEWYLNSISYGGIYVGIEAAAEGYFGKRAGALTLAEAALLAGIPQSPTQYNPFATTNFDRETHDLSPLGLAKARQGEVLDLMARHGFITAAERDRALAEPLRLRQQQFDIQAPHFVLGRIADEVRARFGERALYEDGLEIVTTLDLELQDRAEVILERNIVEFGEPANLHNGAFLALDPHTSEILVYLGSRNYFDVTILGQNDNIVARNSPGSTLKPFTYIAAFMNGWGTGTAILDTPLTIANGTDGDFEPRNPGGGFQGPITAARALGNSLNIPAIKTMIFAGVPETIDLYRRVGYTTLDNPGGYGPALTTGGGEITLLDHAIAYSVLATGGIMRGQQALVTGTDRPGERTLEPVALLRVTNSEGRVLYEFTAPEEQRVLPSAYPYLVSSILSDPQNTCITYGVCGALALPNGYPVVAKTGTSEPFLEKNLIGETWTMGYTPELVAGIWSGNADNEPIQGITSTTVALRAWKEFMVEALEYLDRPSTGFERPAGVVEQEVCWPSGLLPTPDCPAWNRYSSLYAAEVLPDDPKEAPEMYDSWWRNHRLVLPADEIKKWTGLYAWASRVGVSLSGNGLPTGDGTQTVAGAVGTAVLSPGAGSQVSGVIAIAGRATGPDVTRYQLQMRQLEGPTSWWTLSEGTGERDGRFATLDSRQVADGQYVIRLNSFDQAGRATSHQTTITIRNN